MNARLKQLMKDLGEAINGSLSESDQIAQVIAKIKEEGFDIFLVLEATVGFNKQESEEGDADVAPETETTTIPELEVNAQDVRFLKSLKISVDEAA